jgi:hypothetical protein
MPAKKYLKKKKAHKPGKNTRSQLKKLDADEVRATKKKPKKK